MDKTFYAHTRTVTENGVERTEYQPLSDHECGVGLLCGGFADGFGAEAAGKVIGEHHDDGKATDGFQLRLQGGSKVDHATAGAMAVLNQTQDVLLAACIMGHHSGLPDIGSRQDPLGAPTFMGRFKKWQAGEIPRMSADYTPSPIDLPRRTPLPMLTDSFRARMLYSCLVDADYLDTERFVCGAVPRGTGDPIETLLSRLQAKLDEWANPTTELNRLRQDILQACITAANRPKGIYTLTVPTGGGKTISSLAFGLHHAVKHDMKRIVYVVPYTSIIEQNADVFRKILGDENVLEHHSGVQFDSDDELNEKTSPKALAAENWDSPLVITTAVQFFESMYANRSSQCRKLHNLANSVIIFDEAQMLPLCHLMPCVAAISTLVEQFGATAVLCTATQPALDDLLSRFAPSVTVSEICPDIPFYFDKFRRVTFRQAGIIEDDALTETLCAHEQVLCIVNSRKAAQSIFSHLPEDGSFHLSTLMVPAHRRMVLDEIRRRLHDGLPCRVVSTSLVEAGVDVDFPAVYREMAGLDSILQAAGRCNREGKRAAADSIVTIFQRSEPAPPLFQTAIGAAACALDGGADPADPQTMQKYFRELRNHTGSAAIDKIGVIPAFENPNSGCLFPFRTIAEKFRMIDENTRTVYIPWREGADLIDRLCAGACSKSLYRQLGQFSVQVYDGHFQALYNAGALLLADEQNGLDDRSAILTDTSLYSETTGLSLKADSGQAFFG